MTKIKLGIAPIGWSNEDLPELGGHIPFEQCIKEMSAAGYQGCEVGHKFPRDTNVLSKALSQYNLSVASAWYTTYFTEEGREQETITGFIRHMNFLKTMGAKVIVVCECGHGALYDSSPLFKAKPNFSPTQWHNLLIGFAHVGQLAKDNGMTIVCHHHMGTGIQHQEEIDFLMAQTHPDLVSLLLDTGHLACAGVDPLAVIKKHGARIKHVHLKDIRADVLQRVKDENLSFLDGVKAGMFTVPGDGDINFQPIFTALLDLNYEGWWVVEAEQDPDKANPLAYATLAREYLRKTVGF